ncbi:uncharacterized protein LOC62_02G002293 [Vanrija pseudolonga]|uniref:Uncharacterized protein n=1 Tax=Vanrija pseudolonga TaxID=143232 RepID=A0AAF0Y5R3_9TREE|nr:hypothetical protein LOC62_02G002293 [Vanrija pseudolonga]
MLFHTVALAVLASMAAAIPAPEAAPAPDAAPVPESAPVPETPATPVFERAAPLQSAMIPASQSQRSVNDTSVDHLAARGPQDVKHFPLQGGFTVRCFHGPDCQGKELSINEEHNPATGWTYWAPFWAPDNERSSCRFDTWGGFQGDFAVTVPKGSGGWVGNSWSPDWIEVSPVRHSNGQGQQCIAQSGRTKGNSGNWVQKQGRVLHLKI